jgi:hypothetical protein
VFLLNSSIIIGLITKCRYARISPVLYFVLLSGALSHMLRILLNMESMCCFSVTLSVMMYECTVYLYCLCYVPLSIDNVTEK